MKTTGYILVSALLSGLAATSHNKGMGKMLKTAPKKIIPAFINRSRK